MNLFDFIDYWTLGYLWNGKCDAHDNKNDSVESAKDIDYCVSSIFFPNLLKYI